MRWWRPGTLVLLVVVVAVATVGVLALTGRPDRCAVGQDLHQARMLDEAAASMDGAGCDASVERSLAQDRADAAKAFDRAHIDLAAATTARAAAAGNTALKTPAGTQAAKTENDAALAADTRAIAALTGGLSIDPFRADEEKQLVDAITRSGTTAQGGDAITRCAQAERMATAGLLDAAREAIGHAPNQVSNKACQAAADALTAAREIAVTSLRSAEAHSEDDSAARADHVAALRLDTSQLTSKNFLTKAAHDRSSALDDTAHWVATIPGWLTDAWDELLIVALSLFLLLALAAAATRGGAYRWKRLREWLAPADGRGSRMGRRLGRLHVSLTELKGGTEEKLGGADVTALLANDLGAPEARFPFDRMPATADSGLLTRVTDVLAEVPHGKLASAVLKLAAPLFAPRTATIEGRLLPADGDGVGMAISVMAPDGGTRSNVLRERLFDPVPGGDAAVGWARLIGPASVWTRDQLLPYAGREYSVKQDAWKAEALLDAGRQWAVDGDWPRAATCYAAALDIDGDLLPALNNIAVLEARRREYGVAIAHLDHLLERLEATSDHEAKWPALYEAATYNRGLAIIYVAAS